jgi:hypothetical protein
MTELVAKVAALQAELDAVSEQSRLQEMNAASEQSRLQAELEAVTEQSKLQELDAAFWKDRMQLLDCHRLFGSK